MIVCPKYTTYSLESLDAYSEITDTIIKRKVKVVCANNDCGRSFAALLSPRTKELGHSNQGCPEFDDWVSHYETTCIKCDTSFKFALSE